MASEKVRAGQQEETMVATARLSDKPAKPEADEINGDEAN